DGIRDLTVTGVQTCALPISGALSLENWEFSERSWTQRLRDADAAGAIAVELDGVRTPVRLADPDVLDESLWQALFESTSTMVTRSEERRVGKEGGSGGVADH